MLPDIVSVLVPAAVSFLIGILITPVLTHYLYHYKAWKKKPGKQTLYGTTAEEFNRLHLANESRAPRMGGVVIWASAALTTLGIALLSLLLPMPFMEKLNFLTRSQTWIPLATLLVGATLGLVDDIMTIQESGAGMRLRHRLAIVVILSFFIGWWFWLKLDVTAINIPFSAPLEIGWLIIPLFILVSLALYASGVIDGIDGLSGGIFASIFGSYAIIAFVEHQQETAAFCAAVVGGILAFLWFNIPPARYYMSDTGTMALTLTLAVIAFMTDNLGGGYGIAVLPIIGALLVATVASDIAQMIWKKAFGRKLLRIAPLHHHFEALGWPPYKVVMRYWVLSILFAILGVILALAALPI
jgi:phospho-N-acetylmuramoyl-pentapeptide-transferase